MITTAGEEFIRKSMAAEEEFWAATMSIGTSGVAASGDDTEVGFEVDNQDVTEMSRSGSVATVGAVFPAGVACEIKEVCVWGTEAFPGTLLSTFDESEDDITGGTNDPTNVRVGSNSRNLAPGASTSSSITIGATTEFSENVNQQLKLAYFGNNSNIDTIEVRLETDASNYIGYTFNPLTGYNVESWRRLDMVETGTVDLTDINNIRVVVTATGGGAADCTIDGLRSEDIENDDRTLVARKIVSITKDPALPTLVNFDLTVVA